jgi:hypothetical protein
MILITIPPIIPLVSAFIIGIVLYIHEASYYLPLLLGSIGIVLIYQIHRISFSYLFLIGAGLAYGSFCMQRQVHSSVMLVDALNNKTYDARATVVDIMNTTHSTYPHKAVFAIHSLRKKDRNRTHEWQPVECLLHIFYTNKVDFFPGDIIELRSITIKKINKPDFAFYAMKEGIICSLFMPSINYHIHTPKKSSILSLKYRLFQQLKKRASSSCFWLFSSLFLGNKEENSQKHILKIFLLGGE